MVLGISIKVIYLVYTHEDLNEHIFKTLSQLIKRRNDSHNLEGGATSFDKLKYDIKPKLGRALIWTNVNNNLEKDNRTSHQAKQVLNGTKFISQTWIHPKKYT
jgi:hypothetical protein